MDYKNVGEGTYGCVIKPAIKCSDKQPKGYDDKQPSTYENKVSKLMHESDAEEEFKETTNLVDIDGIEQYAIVKPHLCKPVDNEELGKIIKKCTGQSQLKKKVEEEYDLDDISQLLVEDGGINLHNFQYTLYSKLIPEEKILFFKSLLNLFDGLKFFRDKNIIHHDIKLANIVYNIETKTCKYIDFGLVHDRNDLAREMDLDHDKYSMSWPYFPTENECRSKGNFVRSICKNYRNIFKKLELEEIEVQREVKPSDSELEQLAYEKLRNWVLDSFDQYCLCLALHELCIVLRYREEDKNIKQFLLQFEIILFKQCQDHRASKALRRFNNKQKEVDKIKDKEPELSDFTRHQQEEFITNLLKERMRLFDLDEHVIEPYQELLTTLESKSTSSNEKEETKEEEGENSRSPSLEITKDDFDRLPSLIGGGTKKKFPRKKKNKRKTKKQKTKRRKRTTMKKK